MACASPPRAARVLEALFAAERPLTAEEIAGGRQDLGSVYRNLETLESIGVVHHVHLGHGAGRYVLRRPHAPAGRPARAAGARPRSTPQAQTAIRAAVRAATGFDAAFSHFPIAGRCPDCTLERSHA